MSMDFQFPTRATRQITQDAENEDLRTLGLASGTSGTLSAIELGLEYSGAGAVGEAIPFIDVALLAHDIYEIRENDLEAQEKLRQLFERCDDD
jgi:hypothetical protein